MLKTYLAVMFGGAIGTGLRMWLASFIAARSGESFPLGTLVVNVSGSLIIGFFAAFTGPGGALVATSLTRQFVMIGILGGFTTFSSFSLQTLNLMQAGAWLQAALNVGGSVVLCLAAVWLGHAAATALNPR
jgi:fluoride exporter